MPAITRQTKLTRLFDEFYQPLMLRSGSASTANLYHIYIRHLAGFLGRPPVVADFSDDMLGRYASYRRAMPKSVATVNGELAKFKALWTFACKRGVLRVWPTIEDEPEPQRVPMAYLEVELQSLWTACRSVEGMVGDVPAGDFWYALALTLWDSGERVGAVLQLRWEHLDALGGWLTVPAEFRKGRVKERVYRLHPETAAALNKMRPHRCKLLFAWPYCSKYLWDCWEKILDSAGLPTDRRSKFHRIRRSHASHAEAGGLNATELLGHESRRTTLGYLDPRITVKRHASDVLFRPGTSPHGV